MADDAATAEQLRAELRELRRSHVAEVAALGMRYERAIAH